MNCWKRVWLLALTSSASGADWGLQPIGELNKDLPYWLRFRGEYRARMEGVEQLRFTEGRDDRYLLNRIRIGIGITPKKWLSIYAEAQDSHVFWPKLAAHQPPLQNTMDLRIGYVQLGTLDKGLSLQVGRQELTFGEERLIGVANWGNLGRAFNGVHFRARDKLAALDVFATSVVVPVERAWDTSLPGDNLHGIHVDLMKVFLPQVSLAVYSYWRLSPNVRGELGNGRASFTTNGVKTITKVSNRTTLTANLVMQRGDFAGDRVKTHAGYARIRQQLSANGLKPTLTSDFNFASGDKDPRDGIRETFDLLYPTPHDKYGLADQVGWRNIRHWGNTFEITPRSNLLAMCRFHTWWLASVRDGVYNAQGNLLVRDTTGGSGRHVGEEFDVVVNWTPIKATHIGGGVGHIFPGQFLKRASPGRPFTFYYVSFTRSL